MDQSDDLWDLSQLEDEPAPPPPPAINKQRPVITNADSLSRHAYGYPRRTGHAAANRYPPSTGQGAPQVYNASQDGRQMAPMYNRPHGSVGVSASAYSATSHARPATTTAGGGAGTAAQMQQYLVALGLKVPLAPGAVSLTGLDAPPRFMLPSDAPAGLRAPPAVPMRVRGPGAGLPGMAARGVAAGGVRPPGVLPPGLGAARGPPAGVRPPGVAAGGVRTPTPAPVGLSSGDVPTVPGSSAASRPLVGILKRPAGILKKPASASPAVEAAASPAAATSSARPQLTPAQAVAQHQMPLLIGQDGTLQLRTQPSAASVQHQQPAAASTLPSLTDALPIRPPGAVSAGFKHSQPEPESAESLTNSLPVFPLTANMQRRAVHVANTKLSSLTDSLPIKPGAKSRSQRDDPAAVQYPVSVVPRRTTSSLTEHSLAAALPDTDVSVTVDKTMLHYKYGELGSAAAPSPAVIAQAQALIAQAAALSGRPTAAVLPSTQPAASFLQARSLSRDRACFSRNDERSRYSRSPRRMSRERGRKSRSRSQGRTRKSRSRSRERTRVSRSRSRDRARRSESRSRERPRRARSRSVSRGRRSLDRRVRRSRSKTPSRSRRSISRGKRSRSPRLDRKRSRSPRPDRKRSRSRDGYVAGSSSRMSRSMQRSRSRDRARRSVSRGRGSVSLARSRQRSRSPVRDRGSPHRRQPSTPRAFGGYRGPEMVRSSSGVFPDGSGERFYDERGPRDRTMDQYAAHAGYGVRYGDGRPPEAWSRDRSPRVRGDRAVSPHTLFQMSLRGEMAPPDGQRVPVRPSVLNPGVFVPVEHTPREYYGRAPENHMPNPTPYFRGEYGSDMAGRRSMSPYGRHRFNSDSPMPRQIFETKRSDLISTHRTSGCPPPPIDGVSLQYEKVSPSRVDPRHGVRERRDDDSDLRTRLRELRGENDGTRSREQGSAGGRDAKREDKRLPDPRRTDAVSRCSGKDADRSAGKPGEMNVARNKEGNSGGKTDAKSSTDTDASSSAKDRGDGRRPPKDVAGQSVKQEKGDDKKPEKQVKHDKTKVTKSKAAQSTSSKKQKHKKKQDNIKSPSDAAKSNEEGKDSKETLESKDRKDEKESGSIDISNDKEKGLEGATKRPSKEGKVGTVLSSEENVASKSSKGSGDEKSKVAEPARADAGSSQTSGAESVDTKSSLPMAKELGTMAAKTEQSQSSKPKIGEFESREAKITISTARSDGTESKSDPSTKSDSGDSKLNEKRTMEPAMDEADSNDKDDVKPMVSAISPVRHPEPSSNQAKTDDAGRRRLKSGEESSAAVEDQEKGDGEDSGEEEFSMDALLAEGFQVVDATSDGEEEGDEPRADRPQRSPAHSDASFQLHRLLNTGHLVKLEQGRLVPAFVHEVKDFQQIKRSLTKDYHSLYSSRARKLKSHLLPGDTVFYKLGDGKMIKISEDTKQWVRANGPKSTSFDFYRRISGDIFEKVNKHHMAGVLKRQESNRNNKNTEVKVKNPPEAETAVSEATESSRESNVRKRSSSPHARKRSASPRAPKRSASPRARKRSTSPRARKRSASPRARKRSASPRARKRVASPRARKRSASPRVRKRSASPRARKRSVSPRARKRSVSPRARKRSASPRVRKRSASPQLRKRRLSCDRSGSPMARRPRRSSLSLLMPQGLVRPLMGPLVSQWETFYALVDGWMQPLSNTRKQKLIRRGRPLDQDRFYRRTDTGLYETVGFFQVLDVLMCEHRHRREVRKMAEKNDNWAGSASREPGAGKSDAPRRSGSPLSPISLHYPEWEITDDAAHSTKWEAGTGAAQPAHWPPAPQNTVITIQCTEIDWSKAAADQPASTDKSQPEQADRADGRDTAAVDKEQAPTAEAGSKPADAATQPASDTATPALSPVQTEAISEDEADAFEDINSPEHIKADEQDVRVSPSPAKCDGQASAGPQNEETESSTEQEGALMKGWKMENGEWKETWTVDNTAKKKGPIKLNLISKDKPRGDQKSAGNKAAEPKTGQDEAVLTLPRADTESAVQVNVNAKTGSAPASEEAAVKITFKKSVKRKVPTNTKPKEVSVSAKEPSGSERVSPSSVTKAPAVEPPDPAPQSKGPGPVKLKPGDRGVGNAEATESGSASLQLKTTASPQKQEQSARPARIEKQVRDDPKLKKGTKVVLESMTSVLIGPGRTGASPGPEKLKPTCSEIERTKTPEKDVCFEPKESIKKPINDQTCSGVKQKAKQLSNPPIKRCRKVSDPKLRLKAVVVLESIDDMLENLRTAGGTSLLSGLRDDATIEPGTPEHMPAWPDSVDGNVPAKHGSQTSAKDGKALRAVPGVSGSHTAEGTHRLGGSDDGQVSVSVNSKQSSELTVLQGASDIRSGASTDISPQKAASEIPPASAAVASDRANSTDSPTDPHQSCVGGAASVPQQAPKESACVADAR